MSHILISFLLTLSGFWANRPPAGTTNVPHLRQVYLDKTEVTNGQWRTFMEAMQEESPDTSQDYRPDPAIWEVAYGASFEQGQRYDDYPVVGIDFAQAQAFCRWRSEYVSQREKRTVTYRLPSLKVYKLSQSGRSDNKVAEGLYSVNIGFRSFVGLCDNAAEMTETEGVAIRGWQREECLEIMDYVVPSRSLGFRCMAELQ